MTSKDTPHPSFSASVDELLNTWHVPGVSVAIVDGERNWTKGYGLAEVGSSDFTPDTLGYAGSCTKAHVTALLALLIQSGQYKDRNGKPLSWNTTISSLIGEDFVLQDEWATTHITLEDATCHRTGIAKHDNSYIRYVREGGFEGSRRIITLREIARSLRHLPMGSSPRTTFCYSNLMFATLSYVIETVTGQWLGDALRELLWEPLGMNDTYFSIDQALHSGKPVARGYAWNEAKAEYKPFIYMPTEEVSGSGAVLTTALDMTKWLRFLIAEEAPLSVESHKAIRRPHIIIGDGNDPTPFDTPVMYSKGWRTSSYRGHQFWMHHGSMDAYGAMVTFFPGLKFGVAILGNTAFTTNIVAEVSTWELVDTKLGLPKAERHDWKKGQENKTLLQEFSTGILTYLYSWNMTVQAIKDNFRNGLDIVYPKRLAIPTPPSLQISKYAGRYYHAGYGWMDIREVDSSETASDSKGKPTVLLRAELVDNNFRVKCDFAHVSGERWIVYTDLVDAPTLTTLGFGGVEFRVGADGEVETMGIEWRTRIEAEGWIWYDRTQ